MHWKKVQLLRTRQEMEDQNGATHGGGAEGTASPRSSKKLERNHCSLARASGTRAPLPPPSSGVLQTAVTESDWEH